jgi:hypothetical protein
MKIEGLMSRLPEGQLKKTADGEMRCSWADLLWNMY